MDIRDRIAVIKALKEEFVKKQAMLNKARNIRETYSATNLGKLLENNLEQAELILAARDVLDNLQKIAERLAEIGAEEIMPLADNMKSAFGPNIARQFEHTANVNVQKALETVRAAKDAINTAILQVQGRLPPENDMAQNQNMGQPNMGDMGSNQNGQGGDLGAEDMFGGSEAASGPTEEPLGRAKKGEPESQGGPEGQEGQVGLESRNKKGNPLSEKKSCEKDDDKEDLEEKHEGFKKLSGELKGKGVKNPDGLAAWIGRKKYGKEKFDHAAASGKKMHEGKTVKCSDDDDDEKECASKKDNMKNVRDAKKSKRKIEENLVSYGNRILETEKLESLLDWLFETSSKVMSSNQLVKFTSNVVDKTIQDPIRMAGWIGQKKYGMESTVVRTSGRALNESDLTKSQQVAMAIAKGIDANIMAFGRGNAAKVVEHFISGSNLVEGNEETILEAFENIFGVTPAKYSILAANGLLGVIKEDDNQLSTDEKTKVAKAVGEIGAAVAANPSAANQSADSATSKMDAGTQQAVKKATTDNDTSGIAPNGGKPNTVKDMLAKASDKISEAAMQHDSGAHKANQNRPTETSKGKTSPMVPKKRKPLVIATEDADGTETMNKPKSDTPVRKVKAKAKDGSAKPLAVAEDANGTETMNKGTPMGTDDDTKARTKSKKTPLSITKEAANGTETMNKGKPFGTDNDTKAKTKGNDKPLATDSGMGKKKVKESGFNILGSIHNPKAPFTSAYEPRTGAYDMVYTATNKVIAESIAYTDSTAKAVVNHYNSLFARNPKLVPKNIFEDAANFSKKHAVKSYNVGYDDQKAKKPIQSCPKDLDQGKYKQGWNDAKAGKKKEIDENINAANWPVNSMGQYKGEPFETDYGKLKAKTTKSSGDSEGSSSSDDSKETSTETSTEAPTEAKAPKDSFGGKKAEPFKAAPKTEEKKSEPTAKASAKPVEKKEEPKTENAKPFVKKTEKVAATTGR